MEITSKDQKEILKSIHIDVDKGIYEVNGDDISADTSYLNLIFEAGVWSLMITRDTVYASDQYIKDKPVNEI